MNSYPQTRVLLRARYRVQEGVQNFKCLSGARLMTGMMRSQPMSAPLQVSSGTDVKGPVAVVAYGLPWWSPGVSADGVRLMEGPASWIKGRTGLGGEQSASIPSSMSSPNPGTPLESIALRGE